MKKAAFIAIVVVACTLLAVCPVSTASDNPLGLSAKGAVLIEAHGGRVLLEYNADQPLPMASVTKIMTLTLALEEIKEGRLSYDDLVTASEHAKSMGGTQIWLEIGEQMKVRELLFAIAVGSANDAAVAIAEYIAGSEGGFVDMMNAKAKELGMANTVFANATGLTPREIGLGDAPHHSSAKDLAILSRYALQLPGFIELVSTHEYVMRQETTGEPVLHSFNNLLDRVLESGRRYGYPGMDGIKTGMTSEAGYCLAATAKRDNLRLIAVVLGEPSKDARSRDIRALLDYGFRNYSGVLLAGKGEPVTEIEVRRSRMEKVPVAAAQDLVAVVPKGSEGQVEKTLSFKTGLSAPLPANAAVGEIKAFHNGEEVAACELVTLSPVERGSFLAIMLRQSRKLLKSIIP